MSKSQLEGYNAVVLLIGTNCNVPTISNIFHEVSGVGEDKIEDIPVCVSDVFHQLVIAVIYEGVKDVSLVS